MGHVDCMVRMGESWGGHVEVGLFAGVLVRGSSLLKPFSLGLVVGPCTWAKLGSLLNWSSGDRPVWAYKEN